MDCLHIALPFFLTIVLAVSAPLGYKVYKTGLRATAAYVLGLPSRFAGIVGAAYASKLTKLFAIATALGGTIKAGASAVATQGGWWEVAQVFAGEVYRETLSATGLISQGFQQLTTFLNQPGTCAYLVNLDMIGLGLLSLWRGVAIVIVILTLWGYYRSRGRKTEVDLDEKVLVLVALFSVTSLINSGGDTAGLFQVLSNATEFLESLSEFIPSPSGTEGNLSQPDPGNLSSNTSGVEPS